MHNKLAGAILLGSAGTVIAIGIGAAQIATAIQRASLTSKGVTAANPAHPGGVSADWITVVAAMALAVSGIGLIVRRPKPVP